MMELRSIAVLYGGTSAEREVSLSSGPAVAAALEEAGFDVMPLRLDSPQDALDALQAPVDGYFIALHGGWGEDGQIQALLELAGKVYSGSGPQACAMAMDKWASKALFTQDHISAPPGILVRKSTYQHSTQEFLEEALEHRGALVVKPNDGGSTVATTIVQDAGQLMPALELAWEQEDRALVESFIPGRELTVTVWDHQGRPQALPVVEILPNSAFYDYHAKYADGGSEYQAPAQLSLAMKVQVEAMAVQAYQALNCQGYARVDLRLTPEGKAFVLEVNTAPGMTSHSLTPLAARTAGYSLAQFLKAVMEEAWNRRKR